jgi:hypothetical protein
VINTNLDVINGHASGLDATYGTQYVTLQQAQGALIGNLVYYASVSNASGLEVGGTTLSTNWAYSTLTDSNLVEIADVDSGEYAYAFVTTNTFSRTASGMGLVELYAYETGAGSVSVTAEFYVINTNSGLIEYEFEPAPSSQQLPTAASGEPLRFSIPITDFASTNDYFRLMAKIKRTDAGNNNSVWIFSGGSRPTNLRFSTPATDYATVGQVAASATNGVSIAKLFAAAGVNTNTLLVGWPNIVSHYTCWSNMAITGVTPTLASGQVYSGTLIVSNATATTNIITLPASWRRYTAGTVTVTNGQTLILSALIDAGTLSNACWVTEKQ